MAETMGDLRRAAELREIGVRIRCELAGNVQSWRLLDAGRVGAAAVRASWDDPAHEWVETARPLTRRLTSACVGEAFEILAVLPGAR